VSVSRPENLNVSRALAKRMLDLRHRRGWSIATTVEHLAAIGYVISPQAISKQENRESMISVDQAVALTKVFGMPLGELLAEPKCATCGDTPPIGFMCRHCGLEG